MVEVDNVDSRMTLWTDNALMFRRIRREYPERNVLFRDKQPSINTLGVTCYVGYADTCEVVTRIGGVA